LLDLLELVSECQKTVRPDIRVLQALYGGLRLAASVQRADLLLVLVVLVLVAVVLLLLQAVRNTTSIAPATASPRYRLAVMSAECKLSVTYRATRTG
jgi:hypothetical protein